jgi:hypothetical protein
MIVVVFRSLMIRFLFFCSLLSPHIYLFSFSFCVLSFFLFLFRWHGDRSPSTKFFLMFTEHLVVDESWYLPGTLYSRTLDAWLAAMDAAKAKLVAVFANHGYDNPKYEFQKWRMFYIMSSVSFGFNGGNEWMVRACAILSLDAVLISFFVI